MNQRGKFGARTRSAERGCVSLNVVNARIGALVREYDAQSNKKSAAAILEELSQLAVVRDELKKIIATSEHASKSSSSSAGREFPNVGTVGKRLTACANRIAKTAREDAARPELVNEFTRLSLAADTFTKR